MRIGLDVGSTTLKCVVLDDNDNIIFTSYERHLSQVREKTAVLLREIQTKVRGIDKAFLSISGSAGMGLAQRFNIPFIQEAYATRMAALRQVEDVDVVIELGGEDAKILFLTGGMEVRMNGTCAGGTGAFIDQMATLMNVSLTEMNELAKSHYKLYTIASRCGVFAKSDIQPLLNQGASKEDICASIFNAVANQTVGGLAQGRPIKGNVLYLGGPLTFFSELRESFNKALGINGIFPENSLYFVSIGAALNPSDEIDVLKLIKELEQNNKTKSFTGLKRIFKDEEDYISFKKRHAKETVGLTDASTYTGPAYLGVDAGSTTLKAVLMDKDNRLLKTMYASNQGNPIPLVKSFLKSIEEELPHIKLEHSAVTGYGEELIKSAFKFDLGVVETIAHYTAAKVYKPEVDFIIDIGGQDIKCFKIRNGVIDSIFLNEACSSGCGSFLQTFAEALGYDIDTFARLGIQAENPVDLGSRCTVFMNSSVKQAQKDGASLSDISAGLSISVIKNALYKVIRASSAKDLGENIVVQGGTFYNDAVLKAFEDELKKEVIRPDISGLMGAYGAAIYAKEMSTGQSTTVSKDELAKFNHQAKSVICGLCENSCRLTINTFGDGRKAIGGNRCERPLGVKSTEETFDIYKEKLKLLETYKPIEGSRGTIGLPMVLNMYELLPFWHTVFSMLKFTVVNSGQSSREMYIKGQHTISSDTACFPAKLVHGHIEKLLDMGVDKIFYPCLTYNIDEKKSDNHYNCPVVAYYPEVIAANVERLNKTEFIFDYLSLNNKRLLVRNLYKILKKNHRDLKLNEVALAVDRGKREQEVYIKTVRKLGENFLKLAEETGRKAVVLAGRPYHIDPGVNHGISKLLTDFGVIVLSEDSISHLYGRAATDILNQWTYHSRLYTVAEFVAAKKNVELIQLISFGCGLDAITSDEVKAILEENGKIYTQIKIDEITNLGAVKIRIRSLLAALLQKEREGKNG